ncbi:MAG: dTDP-4-dehydrorhamnose reductase [Bacteroidota bacterium]
MKTNVLVTGANGQLAMTIKHLFSENGKGLNFIFKTRKELDITSKTSIQETFENSKIHFCINCAAYTNVEMAESEQDKAFSVNAEGVKLLAEMCKLNDTVLIHISTDYIFDGSKGEPYTEDDITNPLNVYGKSKLRGENYIKEVSDKYYIIRASWLYSSFGKNFLKTILRKIQDNEDLKIIDSQTGTPTSCIDLSEFIVFLITTKSVHYGIYHFSANQYCTWYEYALQIASNIQGYDSFKIKPVGAVKSNVKRPAYSVLSIKKTEDCFKMLNSWQDSVNHVVTQLTN